MGLIARFLPSLIPGLQALVNPWVLLALVAMAAGCFTAGWKVESWRWDASLTAIAEAHAEALKAYAASQREITAGVARNLTAAERDRDTWADSFDEELRHAKPNKLADCGEPATRSAPTAIAGEPEGSGVRLPTGDGAERGGPRLLAGGVRLWNRGLATGASAAERGLWLDAADAGAGPVEIVDAIANVKANAELLGQCRAREAGWHETACRQGWWVGPECSQTSGGG